MREIKFRAWDKKNKRMSEPFYLLDVPFWTNDVLEIKRGVVKARAEILQFTGLKDKNGKDIYEGDIIQDKETKSMMLCSFIASLIHSGIS